MPLAALAAAAVGAGASIYGAKKNADSAQDIADSQNPYDVARANFQTNNPNKYTPFGSVEYRIDEGRPNDPTDDQYVQTQTYSPQMQALMDSMMGIAGAAPATYSSSMPNGLQSKMADVFGSDVPQSQYKASIDGFGQARRPYDGQVLTNFVPGNYDLQGNKVGDKPYTPYSGDPARKPVPDGLFAEGNQFKPGYTSNQEVLDSIFASGSLSEDEYSTLNDYFNYTNVGADNWIAQQGDTQTLMASIPKLGELFPDVEAGINKLFGLVYPNAQDPAEPSPAGYDRQSMDALIQAMTQEGGL